MELSRRMKLNQAVAADKRQMMSSFCLSLILTHMKFASVNPNRHGAIWLAIMWRLYVHTYK